MCRSRSDVVRSLQRRLNPVLCVYDGRTICAVHAIAHNADCACVPVSTYLGIKNRKYGSVYARRWWCALVGTANSRNPSILCIFVHLARCCRRRSVSYIRKMHGGEHRGEDGDGRPVVSPHGHLAT